MIKFLFYIFHLFSTWLIRIKCNFMRAWHPLYSLYLTPVWHQRDIYYETVDVTLNTLLFTDSFVYYLKSDFDINSVVKMSLIPAVIINFNCLLFFFAFSKKGIQRRHSEAKVLLLCRFCFYFIKFNWFNILQYIKLDKYFYSK